ncbi:hypothetical protein GINT2_001258 [Glugoides intestinalis]
MVMKTIQKPKLLCHKAKEDNYTAFIGLLKLKRGDLLHSNKKIRTHKNDFQKALLIDILQITKFPSSDTREELALILNHTARSIQIWFQNNRQNPNGLNDKEYFLTENSTSINIEKTCRKKTVERLAMCNVLEKNFSEGNRSMWEQFISYIPRKLK